MPLIRTYGNKNKIYSVDMMFAYVNIVKPKSVYIDIKPLLGVLDYDSWGEPQKNISFSPRDVLKNPKKKLYKHDYKRIKNADLKYPIIMDGNHIVDGLHRLCKAYLTKQKKIKAYIFTKKEMKKFLLSKTRDYEKIDRLNIYDYIQLFHRRFQKELYK